MRGLAFLFLVSLSLSTQVSAAPITYSFSVLLSQATNVGGVNVGDTLSGTFTYDLDFSTNTGSDSNRGYGFTSGSDFSFAVGGFSRTGPLSQILLAAQSGANLFQPETLIGSENWYITLRDTSAGAFSTTNLVDLHANELDELTNLTHYSQTAPPENDQMFFIYTNSALSQTLYGELTSFSAAFVSGNDIPEPPSIAMLLVAGLMLTLMKPAMRHRMFGFRRRSA